MAGLKGCNFKKRSVEKVSLKWWFVSKILKKVRVYHMDIWGKNTPRRGNSQCRCPDAGHIWWAGRRMWLEQREGESIKG